jgi:hypothetical protein
MKYVYSSRLIKVVKDQQCAVCISEMSMLQGWTIVQEKKKRECVKSRQKDRV